MPMIQNEPFKSACAILENPLAYPDLVNRWALIPLKVWVYPSFEPYCCWSVIKEKTTVYVRKIVWDQLSPAPDRTTTYGAEIQFDPSALEAILLELYEIQLHPFVAPPQSVGLDGVFYGVEAENHKSAVRMEWWEDGPTDWRALRDWHSRTVAQLDAIFPPATPNAS